MAVEVIRVSRDALTTNLIQEKLTCAEMNNFNVKQQCN